MNTAGQQEGPPSRPRVSVVIPTRNRAALLREALDSVLAQDGQGTTFDTEIIVVDDASTDSTPEVVAAYLRVRYVRLEPNRGAAAARNAGIRICTGQYVAFLDDDDLWFPHRLAVHVPLLTANPEVGVVFGRHRDSNGFLFPVHEPPSGYVFEALLQGDFVTIDALLVRRELVQQVGMFDESLGTAAEHYDFALRLSYVTRFLFAPDPVATNRNALLRGPHRARPVASSGYTNVQSRVFERHLRLILERALSRLPEGPHYAELRRRTRASLLWRMAHLFEVLGDTALLRTWLLAELRRNPGALAYPEARAAVTRYAVRLALDSDSPTGVLRALHTDMHEHIFPGPDSAVTHQSRCHEAAVWLNVALALLSSRPRRLDRAAGYSAVLATRTDPHLLHHKGLLKCLVRGVLPGPSWDPLFGALRALRRPRQAA
jgi:glycosyltransferase involved in cell wall biosynthesis